MNKLQIIPALESAEHLQTDLILLSQLNPLHKYIAKFSKSNIYNSKQRDGYVLSALLDLVSEQQIIDNRNNVVIHVDSEIKKEAPKAKIKTTDQQQTKKKSNHQISSQKSHGKKRKTK